MFARLATFITRYWFWVLVAWVVIPLALSRVAPSWNDICKDGDFAYLPSRMTSARGEKLLGEAFPTQVSKSQIVLVLARQGHDARLQPGDFELADRLVEKYTPKEGEDTPVASVWSHNEPVIGSKLKSPAGANGQAVLVVLQLNTEFMAINNIKFIRQLYQDVAAMQREPDFPDGLKLGVTGSAPVGTDMLLAAEESIRNTEMATIALVVIILLVVYRAPGLVVVPLLAIAVSFVVSTDLIALLSVGCNQTGWFDFQVFKTTKIFIVVILFGAATDYCLFLIARYREELERGLPAADAIREALSQTGHALTASAMTTILGLGAMLFADFGKYRYGGPTIALSLIVALAACLTVAPALLRALGKAVFWPFGVKPKAKAAAGGAGSAALAIEPPTTLMGRAWHALAGVIVTRPGLILVAAFIVLAVPAYEGLDVPITYDMLGELNPDRTSVQGTRLLAQHFSLGETGPITVLAYRPGSDFGTDEQHCNISDLTSELNHFEYTDSHGNRVQPILGVRSLTNPLGEPPGAFSPFTEAGRRKMAAISHPRTKSTFLASSPGYEKAAVRFDLICQYDPFSSESMRMLTHVENRLKALSNDTNSPWHGASFDFVGITAGIRDLEAVNTSDTFIVGLLVSLAVLGVLIFLTRRPIISCYLIFTVLLGFFVTLGLTEIFFRWLYADTFHGLDWKLPVFLFVILVAVGEDYNIYLVTRVFEEQRRRGAIEGLREAVIRTGGIITSCGVIMAGTFASMLTGTLRGMIELGFALALGVLLDTFIIRTILVPAFMALWARWMGEEPQASEEQPRAVSAPHFETAAPAPERHVILGRKG